MASERFEMRIPTELMGRLDDVRGYESRASFIRRALESTLVESDSSGSASTRASVEQGLADAKAGRLTDGPPSLRDT